MSNLNKYITLLEKLTNKKVRLIEDEDNNNILIPRRSPEEREKNYLIAINKQIQEYIKNGSKGDLDLNGSPIEKLPDDLIEVKGNLDLSECKNLKSLNNLKYVKGYLDLSDSVNFKELPNDLKIGQSLYLANTSIEKLSDSLIKVNGGLYLYNCKNLKSLNNLRYVDGNLDLTYTLIEKLPDDLIVRYIIYLDNTPLSKNEELLNQYRKKFKIAF
jgi:hypothetical protein